MKNPISLTVISLLLAVSNLSAATHYVSLENTNPTPPYTNWVTAATNIQDAVGAAAAGEEVVVTNGVYRGGVAVTNPVTLRSINGPQVTVINGGGTNQCVSLTDGASLSGFTLTNGWAAYGGGVGCASTNAILTNCTLSGSQASWGAGAYRGTLYNCTLTGNSAGDGGGGADWSTLYNCTLTGNQAGWGGGGGAFHCTLYNCILYFNTASSGSDYDSYGYSTVNYCCTTPLPTTGVGNITNAPLFVDYANGNLRLQSNSPCINAGNNTYVTTATDLDGRPRIVGGTVDMGAYEFQPAGQLYTLTANATEGGSVTKSPDQPSYAAGTQVTVTAVPSAGYLFATWWGDMFSTNNPLVVTMNSNITVNANFALIAPIQDYAIRFDTASDTTSWTVWWGPPNPTLSWDGTTDAGGNPASGSLRVSEAFTGAAGEQFMVFGTLANRWPWDNGLALDCTYYTNLVLDLRVAPGTHPTLNNDYGLLELALVDIDWNWFDLGTFRIPLSATNWTQVVQPINPTLPGLNRVTGIALKMWSDGAFTDTLTFWVDNLTLQVTPLVKLARGDVWQQRASGTAPTGRSGHTAVWTGSEMIVWGGWDTTGNASNQGGRYNPAANSWTAVTTAGAPAGREGHTAVWTGSEMIVWGGENSMPYYLNDGGRYSPADNSWTAVPTNGAPAGRSAHTAVWTGSEMIVWGGAIHGGRFNDGGRYNPAANSWTAVPTNGAPAGRSEHTALWAGSEMIVWGGWNGSYLRDGGRYDLAANSWTAVPTNGAPAGRSYHTAVWTGSEMIVWGGWNGSYLRDGGRYDPAANSWTAVPTNGAPAGRSYHTAVWTGSEMIVWGGAGGVLLKDGGRYNPTANSWTAVTTNGAPAGRFHHTAVWTGSEMIVWGGDGGGSYLNDGGRYNPAANSWTTATTAGAPAARELHTAVWTGSEMIVWGGAYFDTTWHYLIDGGRYSPAGNSWTAVTTTSAPAARSGHTAVWTGSEMIVWGGEGSGYYNYLNDGGRYSPAGNSWTAVTTTSAPAARSGHTAVWTGSEMIVWGGKGSYNDLNDGGRYNPGANSWSAVTTNGAPTGRANHTAVWTGSEMIVWGGFEWNDGGRYNPAANSWTAVTTAGAPAGRERHTAVWTGSEMIVWGGENSITYYLNDGGRYSPADNSWTAVTTNGAPDRRYGHTAVWTGSEMIVWGGLGDGWRNDGGRYNPAANSWTAVTTNGAPAGRWDHTAVWTGSEMIIWGGGDTSRVFSDTWSYYPYAPPLRIFLSGPNSAVVAWPVWSTPFVLWQCPDLGTSHWTLVTNAVSQVGAENQVTLAPLTGKQFFLLCYP